jgi:hypothetical protein
MFIVCGHGLLVDYFSHENMSTCRWFFADMIDSLLLLLFCVLEERKKAVKRVMDSIPSKTTELFAHKVDWTEVNEDFVNTRISPWVSKKVKQYIGEDEPSLVEFICSKVKQRATPRSLSSLSFTNPIGFPLVHAFWVQPKVILSIIALFQ